MWKMLALAFLAPSPTPYITMPQATAQYGQVLRVSVALSSLNCRTSASAVEGEKPISARLDPASEAPVTARNWRRVMSAIGIPFAGLRRRRVYAPRLELYKGGASPRCNR